MTEARVSSGKQKSLCFVIVLGSGSVCVIVDAECVCVCVCVIALGATELLLMPDSSLLL